MNLRGMSFIVVGGGSLGGICNSFVKELLKLNVKKIAIFDIVDKEICLAHLRAEYPNNSVKFYKVDVRSKADLEQAYNDVMKHFGNIDLVLNGAGVANENYVEDCININICGVIYSTQCAIDNMSILNGHKGGYVMNIASICGLKPISTIPTYTASKHAVLGYTRALQEGPLSKLHGMRFISICPGVTTTTLIDSMESKSYQAELQPEIFEKIATLPKQSSEDCAKQMIAILGKSDETTVWLIQNSTHKPVKFGEF